MSTLALSQMSGTQTLWSCPTLSIAALQRARQARSLPHSRSIRVGLNLNSALQGIKVAAAGAAAHLKAGQVNNHPEYQPIRVFVIARPIP